MTLEYLISLGVAEEVAKKIVAEWEKAVGEQQTDEQLEAKITQLEADIQERDSQLKELQEYEGGLEGLKSKLEELETDNSNLKEKQFNTAVEDYLKGVGAKNTGVVLKLLDRESITLTDDGQLEGIEEQVKTLKEENGYLFEDTEEVDEDKKKIQISTGRHKKKDEDDNTIMNLLTGRG